ECEISALMKRVSLGEPATTPVAAPSCPAGPVPSAPCSAGSAGAPPIVAPPPAAALLSAGGVVPDDDVVGEQPRLTAARTRARRGVDSMRASVRKRLAPRDNSLSPSVSRDR